MINVEYMKIFSDLESCKGLVNVLNSDYNRFDGVFDEKFYNNLFQKLESSRVRKVFVPTKYSYSFVNKKFPLVKSSLELFFSKLFSKTVSVSFDIKLFSHGSYTLLSDDVKPSCEKMFFLFVTKKWDSLFGGRVFFKESDDSTFFSPVPNSLVLVDSVGLVPFVEYVNHRAGSGSFFLISGTIKL